MIIKYQISSIQECWGRHYCYVKFLNEKNEVIYSRNAFCDDFNYDGEFKLIKHNTSNCILVSEFERPKFHQFSLIDFKKNLVTRINAHSKTPIDIILNDFKYGNFKVFKRIGEEESFPIEKIKLSLFRRWSKPKKLFE